MFNANKPNQSVYCPCVWREIFMTNVLTLPGKFNYRAYLINIFTLLKIVPYRTKWLLNTLIYVMSIRDNFTYYQIKSHLFFGVYTKKVGNSNSIQNSWRKHPFHTPTQTSDLVPWKPTNYDRWRRGTEKTSLPRGEILYLLNDTGGQGILSHLHPQDKHLSWINCCSPLFEWQHLLWYRSLCW